VMERKSDNFGIGYSPEWAIEVPIDFAVQGDLNHTLYMIGKLRSDSSVDDLRAELMPFISRSHHIDPSDTGAVNIVDVESQVRIFRMINDLIGALVWIIGLGTLIIGVISVSNILLVTVKERQREIGVRRAIGAKPADIVLQFMLESVTMIFIAGLLGMLIALLILLGVGAIAESSSELGAVLTRPYPTPSRMLLSFIIMFLGGIAAGLLPVQKALGIKAIDAIRDE
jgi:putative ABC transport system permease protein